MSGLSQVQIRDIVAQVKSGAKSKTEAFNELKLILQATAGQSKPTAAAALDDDEEEPHREDSDGPQSSSRFSQQERRVLINKLIDKKRSGRGGKDDSDFFGGGGGTAESDFPRTAIRHMYSDDAENVADDTMVSSIVQSDTHVFDSSFDDRGRSRASPTTHRSRYPLFHFLGRDF